MQTRKIIVAVAAMLLTISAARADVLNMGGTRDSITGAWTGTASLEMVHVGDAGNVADTGLYYGMPHSGNFNGQGAVAYEYNIGKYEVTAGQYWAFLRAVAKSDPYGLYESGMHDDCGITQHGVSGSFSYSINLAFMNRPVTDVGFWSACRFANWLANGQPTGAEGPATTERGTYTLDGYQGGDGRSIPRNPGSTWAVTSEDEWYKAAYYKGGSKKAGYWLYPTRTNSEPGRDMNDPTGNNANTCGYPYQIDAPYSTTVVGEFQNSRSPYGTFDQGGNVWEWNETIMNESWPYDRGMRGGSFDTDDSSLESASRSDWSTCYNYGAYYLGFRVVQVPEPASLAALALGGLAVLRRSFCFAQGRRGLRR